MIYNDNINPAAIELLNLWLVEKNDHASILELGCWTGALGEYCQEAYQQRISEWIGVEACEKALVIAEKRLSRVVKLDLNAANCPVLKDLLDAADVILMIDVLEHLFDPFLFLTNLAQRCKGKPVIIVLPNIGCHQIIEQLSIQDFEYEETGILDRTHRYFFTPKSFVRAVSKIGFKIQSKLIYLRNAKGLHIRNSLMSSQQNTIMISPSLSISITSQAAIDSISSYGFGIIISAL